jgi:hypothetical protein
MNNCSSRSQAPAWERTWTPSSSLATGISATDCRLLSKAELCWQGGSQTGAWEPDEKSKMSDKFLLIDYENIQKVNLSDVPDNTLVRIFVGQSQKNIPFELVQQAQRFGQSIEWIRIEGQGSNALDFHIAFYIEKLQTEHKKATFIILSKDKGFDPLIKHINNLKGNCRRINSLLELSKVTDISSKDQNLQRTIEILSKIDKITRPRKRNTLSQYVYNIFQKNLNNSEIDKIIDYLFIQNLVSETSGKLSYNF